MTSHVLETAPKVGLILKVVFGGSNGEKSKRKMQKIEEIREKSVQETVLDRTTPKVGPNPDSRSENGALRLF